MTEQTTKTFILTSWTQGHARRVVEHCTNRADAIAFCESFGFKVSVCVEAVEHSVEGSSEDNCKKHGPFASFQDAFDFVIRRYDVRFWEWVTDKAMVVTLSGGDACSIVRAQTEA